jgi:signal transduction histidine kinase
VPGWKGTTNVATRESNLVKRVREAPINDALLKLIHHELGNGLAVLSGYRHLLQQEISKQAPEAFSPTRDVWLARKEHWLGYLQTMRGREMRLHTLLVQLRELSTRGTDEPLCRNVVRTDLVVLLGQVIEQRVPLYPAHILQASMPAQPLFVMCDPFWLGVLLEHLLSYIVTVYTTTMPTEIHLEPFPNHMGREAKITFRIRSDLPRRPPERDGVFEAQVRDLHLQQGEQEACLALCHEILHEHGGQIWSEQEGMIALALPLAEERTGLL